MKTKFFFTPTLTRKLFLIIGLIFLYRECLMWLPRKTTCNWFHIELSTLLWQIRNTVKGGGGTVFISVAWCQRIQLVRPLLIITKYGERWWKGVPALFKCRSRYLAECKNSLFFSPLCGRKMDLMKNWNVCVRLHVVPFAQIASEKAGLRFLLIFPLLEKDATFNKMMKEKMAVTVLDKH